MTEIVIFNMITHRKNNLRSENKSNNIDCDYFQYQNLDLNTKSNNDELDIEIVMSKSIKFIHDNGNSLDDDND